MNVKTTRSKKSKTSSSQGTESESSNARTFIDLNINDDEFDVEEERLFEESPRPPGRRSGKKEKRMESSTKGSNTQFSDMNARLEKIGEQWLKRLELKSQ